MSVLVTLRAPADVAKFERLAADDPAIFAGILRRAKERGLISHRFWASDTEVFIADEWPNEEPSTASSRRPRRSSSSCSRRASPRRRR